MCNAWNHPSDCTCGWGGPDYLGRRLTSYPSVPPISFTYASYTIPNACCPVCYSPVFFYQSANGGKVFFDELGPPWQKHPCTDNKSVPMKIEPSQHEHISKNKINDVWKSNGWLPFFIKIAPRIDKYIQKLIGILEDEEITLYIKNEIKLHSQPNKITAECITFVRKVRKDGKYEISLINISGQAVTGFGFIYMADVREATELKIEKIKKHSTLANKNERSIKEAQKNASSPIKTKKRTNTAMADAFENAKK